MGGALWPRLERLADRARDLVVSDLAWRAGARLVVKTVQAALGKAIAPRAGRVLAHPELLGDFLVHEAASSCQHDARSICQSLRSTMLARQCSQLALLNRIEYDLYRSTFRHSRPRHLWSARM